MKNKQWISLIEMLLAPALLVVLGLILIVHPTSAAVLVEKILAWALILLGTYLALKNLLQPLGRRVGQIVLAAASLVLGLYVLANPTVISRSISTVLGIFIFIQAIDLRDHGKNMTAGSLVACILGLILVFVPMTLSKVLFVIVGLVCLALGIIEAADRLGRCKHLPKGDDDIIDVDKL